MNQIINNFNTYPVSVAVSNRRNGSIMRNKILNFDNAASFLRDNNIPIEQTHFMHQVHGRDIAYVTSDSSKIIQNVDGLITDKPNVYLAVVTADCLPVLLYAPKSRVVGAVHAGYKGLLSGIIESWFEFSKQLRANSDDVMVTIGPSIRGCCYNVEESRAKEFVEKFGNEDTILAYKADSIFLKLTEVAKVQLAELGVPGENIYVQKECTSCNVDKYFSYRKDSNETFGEFVSVIGMNNE